MKLSEKLRKFRNENGFSQHKLAKMLGVGKITVLRWENDTSLPSPLAAGKLEEIGFGKLDRKETKEITTPRIDLKSKKPEELRDDVRKKLKILGNTYEFDPSPYVINGPENQLHFFDELYKLQEISGIPCSKEEYAKRLSVVRSVKGLASQNAQNILERPKSHSKHWNPNYGPHGWHRYVGRFPPHLVRALLNNFAAKKDDIVCDPFAGSGTTLVESRLLGLRAVGIEICPLSCLISRTKSRFPLDPKPLEELINELSDFYHHAWRKFVGRKNVSTIPHDKIIQRDGNAIPPFPNYDKWLTPEALLGSSLVVQFAQMKKDYERDFVCCSLSSCMRSIGNVDVDVVRAEYSQSPRTNVDVLRLVLRTLRKMVSGIEESVYSHQNWISDPETIHVVQDSVLNVDLDSHSLSHIITSPPYGVESVSYLRTHLLSYRVLAPILKYDPYSFNSQIIGSEYVKENGVSLAEGSAADYSHIYSKFFKKEHFSEPSRRNLQRITMMMHFFDDMVKIAERFSKWLRPGGNLAFVVGNKRIGTDVIPTSDIIQDIFRGFGMDLVSAINHKLKCNNSNSEVPWQERTIQDEYVLIFRQRKSSRV